MKITNWLSGLTATAPTQNTMISNIQQQQNTMGQQLGVYNPNNTLYQQLYNQGVTTSLNVNPHQSYSIEDITIQYVKNLENMEARTEQIKKEIEKIKDDIKIAESFDPLTKDIIRSLSDAHYVSATYNSNAIIDIGKIIDELIKRRDFKNKFKDIVDEEG